MFYNAAQAQDRLVRSGLQDMKAARDISLNKIGLDSVPKLWRLGA
jgi:hypothetical protein